MGTQDPRRKLKGCRFSEKPENKSLEGPSFTVTRGRGSDRSVLKKKNRKKKKSNNKDKKEGILQRVSGGGV